MEDVISSTIEYVLPIWQKAFGSAPVKFFTSIGGSNVQKPNEAIVREAAQSMEVSDLSTSTVSAMGRARSAYRLDFEIPLEAWCVRADVWDASKVLLNGFEKLCGLVAADKTLGGHVSHAQPFYVSVGTATRDKQFIAAINCGIRVSVDIDPIE